MTVLWQWPNPAWIARLNPGHISPTPPDLLPKIIGCADKFLEESSLVTIISRVLVFHQVTQDTLPKVPQPASLQ
jgi:hypothetical protein